MKATDRIGRTLGERYRLERVLDQGGMGTVYAATHTWMDRPVAVKVLDARLAAQPDLVRRFFQEARVASNVRHPNIVDVLDMGEDDDGVPFIAMELLAGETLAARMAREGKLDVGALSRVMLPVMDAITIVHERGILHRDLKPENVFLTRDFRGRAVPKLLDFGVAKLLEEGVESSTRTGSVIGTPAYMAPEQLRGERDIGATADVWSVGVILHRGIAGRLPVEFGPNPMDALMRLATSDLPSLGARAPGTPGPIVAVVDAALARAKEQRIPTMAALMDRWIAALRESGIDVRDPRAD